MNLLLLFCVGVVSFVGVGVVVAIFVAACLRC